MYSAGYDLYSICDERVTIGPHETIKMKTGIALEIPDGYFGAIFARSGIATKRGLRPANCVGVVDGDYRGEIMVALHNDTDQLQFVEPGERIAQLVIMPYLSVEFEETNALNETQRGNGGFGSTGTI
jgi:dUTP pyrophosphatase